MANRNRTTKAQVATVPLGQIALTGTSQNTPAKSLKRICRKHSAQDIDWAKVRLNNSTVTYVSLKDFQRVVRACDKEGHQSATDLVDDLMGLSLHQLFCDAFGIKFEDKHRQRFLTALQRSRQTRKQYTDVIKDSLEKAGIYGTPLASRKFRQLTVQANLALFGQKHFNCDRNNMTEDQLVAIERFEGWVGQLANGYPDWSIEQVVAEALSRTPSVQI